MHARALTERPIGIYEKALPPTSWPLLLENAQSLGFDYVEMSIDESDDRLSRLAWSTAERAQVRQAIDRTGTPVYSICLSAHRRFGLGSAQADVRAQASTILDDAIELAADLGVRMVQIAGYFAYYEPDDPGSRQRYVQGLERGLQTAAERGVTLGIENIDTADVASARDAVALVSMIDHPWLRLYPDVGNFAVNDLDVIENLIGVLPHAVGLHLKDARRNEPRRVPYGEGTVPFPSVFDYLAGAAYDGPFTLEMWNEPATAMAESAHALAWIRDRMDHADRAAGAPSPLSPLSDEARPASGADLRGTSGAGEG